VTTGANASDDGGSDSLTPRGFTGHEMLDDLGLVHMNGRIYDPLLGRMLSADLVVQNPADLQSYNRYSYVQNRPLTLTDPTGFNSMGSASADSVGQQGYQEWVDKHRDDPDENAAKAARRDAVRELGVLGYAMSGGVHLASDSTAAGGAATGAAQGAQAADTPGSDNKLPSGDVKPTNGATVDPSQPANAPVSSTSGTSASSPASTTSSVGGADPLSYVFKESDFSWVPNEGAGSLGYVRVEWDKTTHHGNAIGEADPERIEEYKDVPEVGKAVGDHEKDHLDLAKSIAPSLFTQNRLDAKAGDYLAIGRAGSKANAAAEYRAYSVEEASLRAARNAIPEMPTGLNNKQRNDYLDRISCIEQRLSHVLQEKNKFQEQFNNAKN
jgi:RHS repeat-associated protein